jgi:hypothetical protein
MEEHCKYLNRNCIACKRHLKFRNKWTVDNLTIGKSGCYRKKINGKEFWITCQKCYETICDPKFVKNVYGDIAKNEKSEKPKYLPYSKFSPDSGLLDVHLITRDKYEELKKKYTHPAIFNYELYLSSKQPNDIGTK